MAKNMVGVIGAGVMGSDIALDLSAYGFEVFLKDVDQSALLKAKHKITSTYKLVRLMKGTSFSYSLEELLSRIQFVTELEGIEKADIVIENITEDFELKKKLYLELRDVCREDAVFGVNTSCISITKLAGLMHKPQNVIGMHFLNPVPMKNLVEVIRGVHTSEETLDRTKSFLKTIGKTWVIVEDFPGFVTNRVLMVTINECIWLLQEQVARPEDVDKIFRKGFGHKMGPLATADLIGLDTVLYSLEVLFESYKDPKYRPCPLLKNMVNAGLLGKKTGRGFFKYPAP